MSVYNEDELKDIISGHAEILQPFARIWFSADLSKEDWPQAWATYQLAIILYILKLVNKD